MKGSDMKRIKATKKVKKENPQKLEIVVSQQAPMTIDDFIKDEQSEKSLVPSKITPRQILSIISKTPISEIKKRPGKGNTTLYYVTGSWMKKKLNYTFGFMWDFNIVDKGRDGDFIWVQGKLTIKHPNTLAVLVTKEQFGGAEVKYRRDTKQPLDLGNDYKAAATDALKKCAADLGIASDVYSINEFKEAGGTIIDTTKTVTQAPPKEQKQVNYIELLQKACREAEAYEDDDAKAYIKQITGIEVKSLYAMSQQEAQVIYGKLIQKR